VPNPTISAITSFTKINVESPPATTIVDAKSKSLLGFQGNLSSSSLPALAGVDKTLFPRLDVGHVLSSFGRNSS
jgi:hypothetical protein